MSTRWDETWHRLREWTNGQGLSERLAAQILLAEGFTNVDPSHRSPRRGVIVHGPPSTLDEIARATGSRRR